MHLDTRSQRLLYATVVAWSILLLPDQSWADGKEVDVKVSRESIVGTTRVVLLQVSRTTEFAESPEENNPKAILSLRVVYLLENLGAKPSDAIEGDGEVFAAGTHEPAVRGLPGSHSRSGKFENYQFYLKRTERPRPSRLPKVKDVSRAHIVVVTFDHIEITARKVDLRLRFGLHKGAKPQHLLFKNVMLD